jgi:membrane associated rhomboid family serine protease
VIPIGDENNGRRLTPVVNYGLIAANVVVFLYMLTLSDADLNRFVERWAAIPDEIAHGHQVWGLVTSQFLHGGWLHIGGNMLFLWVFGDNIEDAMGHARYLVFYLLCGFVAAVAHIMANPASPVPTVGASGAISGVMGAYLILYPNAPVRMFFIIFVTRVRAWLVLVYWFLLQVFEGVSQLGPMRPDVSSGVAVWAHVGGFVTGLLLVKAFTAGRTVARAYWTR